MMRPSQEQVREALDFVEGRLKRLDTIVQEAMHADLGDRLDRWKATTVDGLLRLGAEQAAKKLERIQAGRYITLRGRGRAPNFDLSDASLYREFLIGLQYDLQQEPESVLHSPTPQPTNLTLTREGVFFARQQFDALQFIAGLLKSGKTKIEIVDNYLGEPLLQLLAGKAANVQVAILTADVTPTVLALARAFNKQHGGLSIRTTKAFHDRFLVIDARDYYHFGASLKDLGNRGFMFSRIEEPTVVQALRNQIDSEWSRANVVV
jgi:hypothetical protein